MMNSSLFSHQSSVIDHQIYGPYSHSLYRSSPRRWGSVRWWHGYARWSQAGHAVKFISRNRRPGRAPSTLAGTELVDRRSQESVVAAQRLGVAYEILDNPDGQLEPTLYNRNLLIGKIREWQADVVVTHRPNDYHPDHRYTSLLVQDAAYLVMVPNLVPEVLPLRENPVFLYFADHFQKPTPFSPDIAVAIDTTYDQKLEAMHAHTSQFYEWLPWIEGRSDEVPETDQDRLAWLKQRWPRCGGRTYASVVAAMVRRDKRKCGAARRSV